MSKRYVARVALPGRSRRGRLRTDGPPVARGVATPPVDGPAAPSGDPPAGGRRAAAGPPPPAPDAGSTQLLQAPDVTAEIFVDRSGRRARVLRRVVSAVVLLALLLILALWVSQGVDALGLRA